MPRIPFRLQIGHFGLSDQSFGTPQDDAITPAAQLVAEDPHPPRPAAADRAFDDDATVSTVAGSDRRLLDHEPALRHPYLERGVVEVAHGPPCEPCRHRLVDASVQPDGMAAGTER